MQYHPPCGVNSPQLTLKWKAWMPLRHRSVQPSGLFFATTSTAGMVNRFSVEIQYCIALENIEFYRKRDQALVLGYVVMPNHFHLLISIPDGGSISSFMRDLKKRIAFEYYKLKRTSPFPFW
jgi:putative transposase